MSNRCREALAQMKIARVNNYDMAYVDIGSGTPIVCIHGSLNDFRSWMAVMKPLSENRRLIVPSLRHYFPEHWDGQDGKFSIMQHVDDVVAFLDDLGMGPADLIGHSRGGIVAFRLALKRPELVRKLVLAEPAGSLDVSLLTDASGGNPEPTDFRPFVSLAAERIAAGDLDAGLRAFIDGVNGPGTWDVLPAAERQIRQDNVYTLLAQLSDVPQPYSKADAEAVKVPTLFVVGANTPGLLPMVSRTLAAHVPGAQIVILPEAGHSMFRQQPAAFCNEVLGFLAM